MEKMVCIAISIVVILQTCVFSQVSSSIYGTDFYIGLMENFAQSTSIWLHISTPSPIPVNYIVENYSDVIETGTVINTEYQVVNINTSFVVSGNDYSHRFKGIHVRSTNDGLLSVLVINYRYYTVGEYLVYPSVKLPVQQYKYYAISIDFEDSDLLSTVILVGNNDNTTITIVPTQVVTIPNNIHDPLSPNRVINPGVAFTIQLHRMETFLIATVPDLTGTSITSDKPLTVISGHECAYIPSNFGYCDQIIEQVPPTVTWGKTFLLTPYFGKPEQYYKIVGAESETTLSYTCNDGTIETILLNSNGDHATRASFNNSYCSLVSNNPVLVSQLGPGTELGGTGDPVISVIPPVEQHTKEIYFSFFDDLPNIQAHYISIATTSRDTNILMDGKPLSVTWNSIPDKDNKVIGYGAHVNMTAMIMNLATNNTYHSITTSSSETKISLLVYGFGSYSGYSYSAGADQMKLFTDSLQLHPWYGNMLGGTAILMSGPYFEDGIQIKAIFNAIDAAVVVNCARVNGKYALCVSPRLEQIGSIPVTLKLFSNGNLISQTNDATFYSKAIEEDVRVEIEFENNNLLVNAKSTINLNWELASLSEPVSDIIDPSSVLIDIKLHVFHNHNDQHRVEEVHTLDSDISNTDTVSVSIPVISHPSDQTVYAAIISIEVKGNDSLINPTLFDRVQGQVSQWSNVLWISTSSKSNNFWTACKEWLENENRNIDLELLRRVRLEFPCPPTIGQARAINSGLIEDVNTNWVAFFHPKAQECFHQRTITSTNEGSGNECCYDNNGNLIVGPTSGGSVDKVSLVGSGPLNYFSNFIDHQLEDILPFIYCCKGAQSTCSNYYTKRPSDDGTAYSPPIPAWAIGDPHIVTLDLHKYTFNGKGEFILVEANNESFVLQARMIEANDATGDRVNATVFSACAAKTYDSSTIQFEVLTNVNGNVTLVTFVDEERVVFDEIRSQEFDNVTIIDSGNNTISATFSNGAFLQVQEQNGFIAVLIVSLPNSFVNKTKGLMGVFNGNISDEFTPRKSDTPLPLNSTLEQIHKDFGITWIIDDPLDSLFTYQFGKDWSTYYHPSFIPLYDINFTNDSLENVAKEICKDDEFCKYDIAATGRSEIGEATYKGGQDFEQLINLSQPIICNPKCVHGACVDTNICACGEGYEGTICNITVYSQCDQNFCNNSGTCQYHAGTYICTCSPGFTGTFCDDIIKGWTPTPTPTPQIPIIIGVVVGIGIFLVILVIAGIVFLACIYRGVKVNQSVRKSKPERHQMSDVDKKNGNCYYY